jgi:FixJ family two-component response regulator
MHPLRHHPTSAVERHGRVVVVVEDDVGLRGALERVLRTSGFEAQAYPSAETVLADRSVDGADCLVVDLDLPRLRARGMKAPAVAISAQDPKRARRDVGRRGIDHFLAKPFSGSALVRLIDDVLHDAVPPSRGS